MSEPGAGAVDAAVAQWRELYGHTVESRFLDRVLVPGDDQLAKQVLTQRTLRMAFTERYGESRSTRQSFAGFYPGLIADIERLQPHRTYVQKGTVFLGSRPRPSYNWEQRHWGITPEALHGLTIDTGKSLSSQRGMGAIARMRAANVLAYFSAAPPGPEVSQSDWPGFEGKR
ncbi:MAG TPA: hypothetical protein VK674_01535 [Candidatus Limnocylindria bacterium]|nr:hypothetical protein [Candidatus Limnocylindria bacterium]